MAIVYESREGWHVNLLRPIGNDELAAFNAGVDAAKQNLSHYVNRLGSDPPEEITTGALSLWLMQKDDGTVLGIDLYKRNGDPLSLLCDVSSDVEERIRSMARAGHRLEAIRELRMATNCSLEQAKAWLNDNC